MFEVSFFTLGLSFFAAEKDEFGSETFEENGVGGSDTNAT